MKNLFPDEAATAKILEVLHPFSEDERCLILSVVSVNLDSPRSAVNRPIGAADLPPTSTRQACDAGYGEGSLPELRRQLFVLNEHAAIACALWQEEIGISVRWKRTAFASFTGNIVLVLLVLALVLMGVLR